MTESAPCPNCSSSNSKPVGYTWWGGVLGPKLLNHVKCQDCGTCYNGKTGQSNRKGIIIYTIVVVLITLVLLFLVLQFQ